MRDTIPDRPTLRPLVLAALYNSGGECSKQEIAEEIAEAFQLSDKARAETTGQGRNKLMNQIDWVTGKDLGVLGLLVDHGERVTLTELGEKVITTYHDEPNWRTSTIADRISELNANPPTA